MAKLIDFKNIIWNKEKQKSWYFTYMYNPSPVQVVIWLM